MKIRSPRQGGSHERVMVTLPKPLVEKLRRFAGVFRGGNKSGFVADAIQSHIERLRKARHTAKLRESYAAAGQEGLAITKEWEAADDELGARLEERKPKRRRKGK